MSLISDNYNLILPYSHFLEYDNNIIIKKIIKGTNTKNELEILQNTFYFDKTEIQNDKIISIMTNYVQSYKKNLIYQKKKNKENNINIETIYNFINNTIQRIQNLSYICGSYKNSKKKYGESNEISNIIHIFWKNLLQENWLNQLIFQNIFNKNNGSIKYINLINNLNGYSNTKTYYNWFLNNLGIYLLDNIKFEYPFINNELTSYYKLLIMSQSIKKYYNFNKLIKSNLFLVPIKKSMIEIFKNILNSNDKNIQLFIITNQNLILNIYKYSNFYNETNYQHQIIVRIIYNLLNDQFTDNLFDNINLYENIIGFINKLVNECNNSESLFINKLFSETIFKNKKNINIFINEIDILSPPVINYTLKIICINDITKKYFEMQFKQLLTNFLLEQYIKDDSYDDNFNFDKSLIFNFLNKLEKYFSINSMLRLNHDIIKMKYDYKNSKIFFDSFHKSFKFTNFDGFIMNPFVWNCNNDLGHIDSIKHDGEFGNKLIHLFESFEKFTGKKKNNESNRCLLIHPHLGEIKFNLIINDEYLLLTVLPIQYLLIEQIISKNITCQEDLYNNYIFKGYSNKYIQDIISSLYNGHFLLDNSIVINPNINEIQPNLLELTFIHININKKQIKKQFVFSQKIIISTWINKLLKHNSLSFDEILEYIKNQFSCGFIYINSDILATAINYMIKNEYILFDNNKYHKIIY